MIQQYLFYIFAGFSVLAATIMIISSNPVRSALCLVFTFISTAGLWLLAGAEFLSLVLILVYVGAVMTLFLFVIMMIQIDNDHYQTRLWKSFIISMLIIAIMSYCMHLALEQSSLVGRNVFDREIIDNVRAIGMVLYTDFGFSFIISGILLLVAIVSAIILVNREKQGSKSQIIDKQVRTNKSDRLRLIDIKKDST